MISEHLFHWDKAKALCSTFHLLPGWVVSSPLHTWDLMLYESCDSRRNPTRASSTRVPRTEPDYPSTPAGFETAFLRSRGAGGCCLLHTVEEETTTTTTSRSLRQKLWWAGLAKNKHEEPPSIGGPGSRHIIKAEAYSPNEPVSTSTVVT